MFKQVVIHYPKDEKALKYITKEIAAFHSAVAVKYMDSLNLNNNQKIVLIDSLLQDLTAEKQITA